MRHLIRMQNTFVISWKSKTGASAGQGKRFFSQEEAQQLADELNRDYPEFTHEAFNTAPAATAEASAEAVIIRHVDFAPAAATEPLPAKVTAVA